MHLYRVVPEKGTLIPDICICSLATISNVAHSGQQSQAAK